MILTLQQGLAEDGMAVSLVKLCQWFQIPRRTVYYRSCKSAPKGKRPGKSSTQPCAAA
ncbi:hypothetical protein PSQ40_06665 [Curvibacter sp. HBC61]|uniref:Uncharacterized protein n=1 Tax=Curvibacter cyanobacteriorum TaxID=3026422 RepID=A0ABT5MW11_9BURK|nr:hypothetical protein [Curvibacter sp. HBC61]MDD0838248.1 hypothetical protein [Curvibacter sp. HBC61]